MEKFKIVKTGQDFINFIEKELDGKQISKWLFGNLSQLTEGDFEKNDNFELKYWAFTKNDNPDHLLKVQRNETEFTFIIKGEVIGTVGNEKVNLKTGDYIIIKPGVVNNLIEKVIDNTVGITIKSPSQIDDTVKIYKGGELVEKNKERVYILNWYRIISGLASLLVGAIILFSYKNILFAFINSSLLFWILGWAFLSFGLYVSLLGTFWWWEDGKTSQKEDTSLRMLFRKYFRYFALVLVLSILAAGWLNSYWTPEELNRENNIYLIGLGLGIFLGVWTHTIYQGIDKLRDNLKIP